MDAKSEEINLCWRPTALKSLRPLSQKVRDSIANGLARYAATGRGKLCRLRQNSHIFRLKVGDYRVLLAREGAQTVVVDVLPRKSAYRDLHGF